MNNIHWNRIQYLTLLTWIRVYFSIRLHSDLHCYYSTILSRNKMFVGGDETETTRQYITASWFAVSYYNPSFNRVSSLMSMAHTGVRVAGLGGSQCIAPSCAIFRMMRTQIHCFVYLVHAPHLHWVAPTQRMKGQPQGDLGMRRDRGWILCPWHGEGEMEETSQFLHFPWCFVGGP